MLCVFQTYGAENNIGKRPSRDDKTSTIAGVVVALALVVVVAIIVFIVVCSKKKKKNKRKLDNPTRPKERLVSNEAIRICLRERSECLLLGNGAHEIPPFRTMSLRG